MQVAKVLGVLVLAMAIGFVVGCTPRETMAEQAREVNYQDYGDLGTAAGYGEFRLEEFMAACGAVTVFQEDGATIISEMNGWRIEIETYAVPSGYDEPFWCTQILLSGDSGLPSYAFGHVKGAMPRTLSQPERVLVYDSSPHPWKQRMEKAALEDLIDLMVSGNLWEDKYDPLEGLGFAYKTVE